MWLQSRATATIMFSQAVRLSRCEKVYFKYCNLIGATDFLAVEQILV